MLLHVSRDTFVWAFLRLNFPPSGMIDAFETPKGEWVWRFGDGHIASTTHPYTVHDFTDYVLRQTSEWVNVTLRVALISDGKPIAAAKRTLGLHNYYASMKRRTGILQPPARDEQAWVEPGLVRGSFHLSNLESEDVIYDERVIEWRRMTAVDLQLPEPADAIMPITVPAGDQGYDGVADIPLGEIGLPDDVWGVAVHLRGRGVTSGAQARSSLYFDLRPYKWWVETRQPVRSR
jgi:hypothetical protein